MYSASILIVYEGDSDVLGALLGNPPKTPRVDERAPTTLEIRRKMEEEDEDEEEERPATHRVKMIDFAHAAWKPGAGPDENVIKGLKNIEDQIEGLIARLD
jgi:1D-myo-inositol-tetrakisphosphate 5-kinase/inositol-polyphosphate multikinase